MSAVTEKSVPEPIAAAASKIASTDGAAATAVSSSTDLVVEILSRLPVETLCRFRCASKQWHSLISDPTFIAAHDSRAESLLVCSFPGDTSLWLMDMDGNVVKRMKGVDTRLSVCTNLACFDNLACFTDVFPNPQLIDLATGEMLLARPKPEELVLANPGYYPVPLYSYSVGRTAMSRLYKVVGIISSDPFFLIQTCHVLTLGDGAGWRQTQPPAAHVTLGYQQATVTMEGVMYFLVFHENKILCFDLENEEWNREIEGPWVSPDLKLWNVNIAQLNGSLCIAQTVHAAAQAFTDIWLLTDSEKSIWRKTYTIPTPTSSPYLVVKPLTMLHDGRKLLFCCGVAQLVSLHVYDPSLQTCTDVKIGLAETVGVCNLRLERFVSASS